MPEHWRETNVSVGLLAVGATALVAGIVLLATAFANERFAWALIGVGAPISLFGLILLILGPKGKPLGVKASIVMKGEVEESNVANTQDVQNSNVLTNQGEVKDSHVLNNQGTIVGDVVVGNIAAPPDRAAPSVTLTAEGRCCFLWVTNNDVAESFVIEVSEFGSRQMRALWDDDTDQRTLKKGERGWARILCLEPDRPMFSGPYRSIVDRISYLPWKDRVEKGIRLVRFFGKVNQDVVVQVNQEMSFVVRVLSDHHEPWRGEYSYAATEHCRLVMPFDPQEIQRMNAADSAFIDNVFADAKEQTRHIKDQGSEINS